MMSESTLSFSRSSRNLESLRKEKWSLYLSTLFNDDDGDDDYDNYDVNDDFEVIVNNDGDDYVEITMLMTLIYKIKIKTMATMMKKSDDQLDLVMVLFNDYVIDGNDEVGDNYV